MKKKITLLTHVTKSTRFAAIIMSLYVVFYYMMTFGIVMIYRDWNLPNWADPFCHTLAFILILIVIATYEPDSKNKSKPS